MKMKAVKYVHLWDIFTTREERDWFEGEELPWTFGDCYLSLITTDALIVWLCDNGREVSNQLNDMPADVLIALHEEND